MKQIIETIEKLIRRFRMDWDQGEPVPIPVRDDEPAENPDGDRLNRA